MKIRYDQTVSLRISSIIINKTIRNLVQFLPNIGSVWLELQKNFLCMNDFIEKNEVQMLKWWYLLLTIQ